MRQRRDITASSIHAEVPSLEDLKPATDFVAEVVRQFSQTEAGATLMAPGQMLFEELGVNSSGDNWQLAAFLIGWFFWLRLIRVTFFASGRIFGFSGPEAYIVFTRFWLPWQKPFQLLVILRRLIWQWGNHTGHSQYWAGFWTMASYPFNPGNAGIPLGRLALFQRFGLHMTVGLPDTEKSVAVIAASGSGKSAWIAYWLGCLKKKQAACIFDMDGAFVNSFGALLQKAGHRVIKIDVDHINKSFPDGRWNPMLELIAAAIRHGAAAVTSFAKLLAEALIVEDSTTQPVFAKTARVIMKALILFVWLTEKEKASLVRVRQLLNRGLPELIESDDESGFGRLIFEMSALPARYADGDIDDGCGGAICNEIANCCGLLSESKQGHDTSEESPDNFRKTAIYQTDWIDDANVVAVIGGESDISCDSMKLSNDVVFIVSTLTDTQTRLAPLVRAFTMHTIYAMQRTEPEMKLKHPVLLILDEFPNLGRGLDICAVAAPGFRKFGLRLVIISQSVGLLRESSPNRYREFLNQAACVIWMGIAPTDKESLAFLTGDVLGQCARKEKIDGWHWLPRMFLRTFGLKLPPARYQMRPQLLLDQQQASAFLARSTGQCIVTFEDGSPPWRLKRLMYWKDLPVWKYAVHPGHGEQFCRANMRLLISLVQKG